MQKSLKETLMGPSGLGTLKSLKDSKISPRSSIYVRTVWVTFLCKEIQAATAKVSEIWISRLATHQKGADSHEARRSVCKPLEGPQSIDSVNIGCIVFFPVSRPLTCGRQSRCLCWIYKLPGGQKFSFKSIPL